MDTNSSIISTWQHTYRELTGREGDVDEIVRTFGEMLTDSMKNAFPGVSPEVSVSTYRKYQEKVFEDTIEVFDGMIELLEEVKRRGYKTAIATSRLRKTTEMGMARFDLHKYFDVMITAEDVTNHKPHPETVTAALSRLDSQPEEAVMIGDTLFDILCARNAGVTSVLAGWSIALKGKRKEDFAQGQAPDFIISTPSQLLDII